MTRKMNRILSVVAAVLLITLLALRIGWHPDVGVSAASCSVSGTISSGTTWSPATCDPYIVTASLVVQSGVTLTIAAGTTVKFDSSKGLLVQGTLVARGTAANPITFTSNQAAPAKGDWGEIAFTDSSTGATFDGSGNYVGGSIVQYAVIEYAGAQPYESGHGALRIEASSPYIDHNTIRNNSKSGIRASGTGALRVTNNTITGNSAGLDGGGGIFVEGGTVTISNNTITGNLAGEWGGGIYVQRGTVTINNNTITGNTVSMNGGGGIYVEGSPVTITISSNTITGNTVGNPSYPSSGGGISAGGIGTVAITDNTITGNSGSTSGGGIYASGTVTITGNTITNNTITGNSRTDTFGWRGLGGGISASGTATITDNVITGNSARNGGGIYLLPWTLVGTTINNNDLYSNTSGSPATANDLYNGNLAGGADVNAENNYWGTTDPTVIEDHIWHFPDDSSVGLVDYIPLRTSSIRLTLTPLPAYQTGSDSFSISWTAPTTWTGEAASSYDVQYRDGPSGAWTDLVSATTTLSTTFNGQDGHIYYFQARSRTATGSLGDWSDPISTTVDLTTPTGSIQTQGWSSPYISNTVTLSVSASDATSGVSQMQLSNDGATYSPWQAYSTNVSYAVPPGASAVYAKFKDSAGNASQPVSATVTLDSTPPTGSMSTQGWASNYVTATILLSITATDSVSGLSQMHLEIGPESHAASKSGQPILETRPDCPRNMPRMAKRPRNMPRMAKRPRNRGPRGAL